MCSPVWFTRLHPTRQRLPQTPPRSCFWLCSWWIMTASSPATFSMPLSRAWPPDSILAQHTTRQVRVVERHHAGATNNAASPLGEGLTPSARCAHPRLQLSGTSSPSAVGYSSTAAESPANYARRMREIERSVAVGARPSGRVLGSQACYSRRSSTPALARPLAASRTGSLS